MKKLVNGAQMKAIDTYSMEKIGIPSLVLMENAATQTVQFLERHISKEDIILVFCGPGNNGGDGLAIARILLNHGYQVDVFFAGEKEQMTPETHQQMQMIENLDILVWNSLTEIKLSNYTVLVDALLGIGLSYNLQDPYVEIVEEINRHKGPVYAVDIPSGIAADDGKVKGTAVKADYTVTFGIAKIGHVLYPGAEYCGELVVTDSGFPPVAVDAVSSNCVTYDKTDLDKLPKRKDYSNKGTFGKVLVIAGSENMSGAAYLSAKAAYRTGAGLVEILTPEANRTILQIQIPEAILTSYDPELLSERSEKEKIKRTVEQASHVIIGPGIGTSKASHELLDLVTLYLDAPVVFDADAINLTAAYYNTFPLMRNKSGVRISEFSQSLPPGSIITPHLKELARLLDRNVKEIQQDLLGTTNVCTYDSELVFVVKDARTIVAHEDQRYINTSGNSGMSTGGTGDVLTGILAGLLAQGMEPFEAAKLGVYIHGLAGDYAAKKGSPYSLMASDVIEALGQVMKVDSAITSVDT